MSREFRQRRGGCRAESGVARMNDTIRNFGYPQSLVHEYGHWVVLARPQQVTLGALILAARSDATAFHELPEAAFAEMAGVIGDIETALTQLAGYDKINYLMLMMVDPHVHFHVIPRYANPGRFADIEFPDPGWPGPPALGKPTECGDVVFAEIVSELKNIWPD